MSFAFYWSVFRL